jgi:hypothetical protein
MNLDSELLRPLTAQVLLTACVWATLLTARLVSMIRNRVKMEELKGAQGYSKIAETDAISDNFENQFEVPVLFYLVLVLLMVSGKSDPGIVTASWVFVVSRMVHSLIHCTFNSVYMRFSAYLIGCISLGWIWWRAVALWA